MTSAEGSGERMDLTPLWLPLAIESKGVNKQLEHVGKQGAASFERATRGMGKGFETAAKQAAGAMNNLAPVIAKVDAARRKAADAAGKQRIAELALTAAQEKGKATKVQMAQAEERASKAKRDAKAATDSLRTGEQELARAQHQLAEQTGRSGGAFRQFFAGMRDGHREARGDMENMNRGMTGSAAKGTAAGMVIGTAIAGGFRMASAGVTGFIRLADDAFQKVYQLGREWDTVSDQIKVFTSTSDAAYESLNRSAERVAGKLPGSLDGLGKNIGIVSSRLGLTGKGLEDFTRQAMEAGRLLEEPLNLRNLTGSMKAFGVAEDQMVGTLNDLFNISRRTGVPINDLINATKRGAPFLKQFGLGFGQSASLLAQFDQAGVDTGRLVRSLGKALGEFADDGRKPADALKETLATVEQLMVAGENDRARNGLQSLFGDSAGVQIFSLMQSGVLTLEDLQAGFIETGETIDQVAAKTNDLPEKVGQMVNRAKVAARPLAEGMFAALGPQVDKATGFIENHSDAIVRGFVTAGQYALGFGKTFAQMTVGVLRLYANLSSAGSRTVGTMLKGLTSFTGYVGGLLDTLGVDTLGMALKDISQAGSDMLAGFDKTPDTLNAAADAIQRGFIDNVDQWSENLATFGDDLNKDIELSKALGDSIVTQIPDSKEVRIEGNVGQVVDNFRKLGVEIETTPDGKIIAVKAPTQEAADQVKEFIKTQTGQDVKVDIIGVNPKTGKPPKTLKDLLLPQLYDPPPINVPTNIFAPPTAGQPGVQVGGPTPPGFLPPGARPGDPPVGAAPAPGSRSSGPPGPLPLPGQVPSGSRGSFGNSATFLPPTQTFSPEVEQWRGYVRQALTNYGADFNIGNTAAWENAIMKQIDTESGGHPGLTNTTDSNAAAGHPSTGLLQFIPTTYEANNVTGRPANDPYGQMVALLKYVTGKYGMNPDGSPKQIGQGVGYATGRVPGFDRGRVPVSPHGPRQPATNATDWRQPWEPNHTQWGPLSPIAELIDTIRGKPMWRGMPGFDKGRVPVSPHGPRQPATNATDWRAAHEPNHSQWGPFSPIAELLDTMRGKPMWRGFDKGRVGEWGGPGPKQPATNATDWRKPHEPNHSQWGPFSPIAELLDTLRGKPSWRGFDEGGIEVQPGSKRGGLNLTGKPWADGWWDKRMFETMRKAATGSVDSRGVIHGPGTGTSDSIVAMLGGEPVRVSNQESIITAKATQANAAWLHAMNKGLVLPKMPRFDTGRVGGSSDPDAKGTNAFIQGIANYAAGMGLDLTSGMVGREGQKSMHASGDAGDFSNGSGNTDQQLAFATYMARTFGSQLDELIYDDPRWNHNIMDGRDVGAMDSPGGYTTAQAGDHTDHVHVGKKDDGTTSLALGSAPLPGMDGSLPSGSFATAYGAPGSTGAGVPMDAETAESYAAEQNQRAENVTQAERSRRNAEESRDDAIYARDQAAAQLQEARAGGVDEFGNPTPADPAAVESAVRNLAMAERAVRDSTEALGDSETQLAEARNEALKPSDVLKDETKKSKESTSNANAESLGGGLVTGAMEALGFDGSVFGDPTQWGIWKLFTGVTNHVMGGFKKLNEEGLGGVTASGAGGGGGGGGFGDIISGLLGGAGLPGVQSLAPVNPQATTGAGLAIPSAVSNTAAPGSAVAPAERNIFGGAPGALPGPPPTIDRSVTIQGNVGLSPNDVGAQIQHGFNVQNRQPTVGFPAGAPHP